MGAVQSVTNRSTLNVILLVLDSVRADHLSVYGYCRKTSPKIDDIAKEGVIFDNAFSAAPWTVPSHASIFTGKYPSHHKCGLKNMRLGRANITLAEILRRNGYHTMAITACPLLRPEYGIGRGFDDFISTSDLSIDQLLRKAPKEVVRILIFGPDKFTFQNNNLIQKLLKKSHSNRKPFFLFVNYFNCHTPYDPPKPFKEKFCGCTHKPRAYITEFILKKVFGRTSEKISNSKIDIQKVRYIASGQGGFSFMAGRLKISAEEWEIVKSWYDGEITYLDYHIGELIKFLKQEDLFDNTLLIITSDHGENFGEHGLASHGYCLYDTVLHIPLIMTCPSVIPKKRRISKLVSTIDILPTVLRILNIRKTQSYIQGVSLYPFQTRKFHSFICAEFEQGHTKMGDQTESGLKCIRSEFWKYIISSKQEEELYNLQNDHFEERNVVDKYPSKAEFLRKEMENIIDISYFGPKKPLTKEENQQMVKRLKALGYV